MGFGVIGILVDFFVRGFFFSVVLVFGLGWKFLGLLAYGFFFYGLNVVAFFWYLLWVRFGLGVVRWFWLILFFRNYGVGKGRYDIRGCV